MTSRLFHAIVVCGAALGASSLGCATDPGPGSNPSDAGLSGTDAGAGGDGVAERCKLPEGGCGEHCSPLGDGGCLDPCFVHTVTCSPDCLRLDGSCGWPPTK